MKRPSIAFTSSLLSFVYKWIWRSKFLALSLVTVGGVSSAPTFANPAPNTDQNTPIQWTVSELSQDLSADRFFDTGSDAIEWDFYDSSEAFSPQPREALSASIDTNNAIDPNQVFSNQEFTPIEVNWQAEMQVADALVPQATASSPQLNVAASDGMIRVPGWTDGAIAPAPFYDLLPVPEPPPPPSNATPPGETPASAPNPQTAPLPATEVEWVDQLATGQGIPTDTNSTAYTAAAPGTPNLVLPAPAPSLTPDMLDVPMERSLIVQWDAPTTTPLPPPPPLPREEVFEAPSATPIPTVPINPAVVPATGVTPTGPIPSPSPTTSQASPLAPSQLPASVLTSPTLNFQGVAIYQADDFSARARLTGVYPATPRVLGGITLDLIGGDEDPTDFGDEGVDLNELYVAVAPESLPSLRFVAGQVDLTSYFDRNSFAKDGATQFFNDIFQTNPALAAANIDSRPGVVVNWSLSDNLEARVSGFSSDPDIGDFQLDGFAGEVGLRFGNAILRGTYVSARDTDLEGDFDSERLEAYGVNFEVFIPEIRLGLFGRYGQLISRAEDFEADTYSLGFSFLDVFMEDDRLGLAYGRNLSDEARRRRNNDPVPDALELFYDFRLSPNIRLGFTFQQIDDFSDSIAGVRLLTDFDILSRD
ncbi:MAG: porin [Cyanobacteria bacterium J06638_20]